MEQGPGFSKKSQEEVDKENLNKPHNGKIERFLKNAGIFGLGAAAGATGAVTAEKIFADGNQQSKVNHLMSTAEIKEKTAYYMNELENLKAEEAVNKMHEQGEKIFGVKDLIYDIYTPDSSINFNLPEELIEPKEYCRVEVNKGKPTTLEDLLSKHEPFTELGEAYGLTKKLLLEKKDGAIVVFKHKDVVYCLEISLQSNRVVLDNRLTLEISDIDSVYFAN